MSPTARPDSRGGAGAALRALAAVLLLGWMLGALGGTQDAALAKGTRAYAAGDYAGAVRYWRPLAEAGDADAQFALGTLYQAGHGVEQSDRTATRWFRRAAKQGSVPAQYNLGNAYKHGRGVKASDRTALYWWRKAAEAGLAPAQFNVGTAYLYGRGVARSTDRGLAWYRKAARNGHPGARAVLQRLAAGDGHRILGTDWVRGQPADHYTVQLLAAADEAAARQFVASLPDGDYALCPYRSRGKRWVAVLAGSFPSQAAAKGAVSDLGVSASPWVRRFAALQAQLAD